jgi:hypothetical protein
MRYTVDFHDQFAFGAIEIRNISADRVLPAELNTHGVTAQNSPQQNFGQRHFGA